MAAPKLTPEIHQRLCTCVKLGMDWEEAAQFCRVRRETIWKWRNKGASARSGKYRQLYEDLEHAKAEFEYLCLGLITRATQPQLVRKKYDRQGNVIEEVYQPGQWTAAAWLLERRIPARYRRPGPEIPVDDTDRPPPVIEFTEVVVVKEGEDAAPAAVNGTGPRQIDGPALRPPDEGHPSNGADGGPHRGDRER